MLDRFPVQFSVSIGRVTCTVLQKIACINSKNFPQNRKSLSLQKKFFGCNIYNSARNEVLPLC